MIDQTMWGGILGFAILFLANPIQWHRIWKRRCVDDISFAWLAFPIMARFLMGFTAYRNIIWMAGNVLILGSCIMTAGLVLYFKGRK